MSAKDAALELYSFEYIKDKIFYDSENGRCFWKRKHGDSKEIRRWNARYALAECGYISGCGYRLLSIKTPNGKIMISMHRLVFFMENGRPPTYDIDHIDQNKLNNKPSNLRDVPCSENLKNKPKQKNNTSGITGVRWRKDQQKWQARVIISKKENHLGYFDSINDAEKAVIKFRIANGFTENHGK